MVANLLSKQDPKIARNLRISWENWDFPSPKLHFSSHKIQFSSMAFRFPRNLRKSSSTAFRFLQLLSAFFNSFPLFEKSGKIYPWRQVYQRLLSELCISAKIAILCDKTIGGKNTKDHYPSFVFSAPSFVILAN